MMPPRTTRYAFASSSFKAWKTCRSKAFSKKWLKCEQDDARAFNAREMPASVHTIGSGDAINSLPRNATVHDAMQLEVLRDFFPTFELEVIQEVFCAAHFRLDLAAEMLGSMVVESSNGHGPVGLLADAEFVDMPEHGDEVMHPSQLELQQWVVVQDDWEIVDISPPASPTMPTMPSFAAIVKSQQKSDEPELMMLPAPVRRTTHEVAKQRVEASVDIYGSIDDEEVVLKSFGARKRRSMAKYHRGRRGVFIS